MIQEVKARLIYGDDPVWDGAGCRPLNTCTSVGGSFHYVLFYDRDPVWDGAGCGSLNTCTSVGGSFHYNVIIASSIIPSLVPILYA